MRTRGLMFLGSGVAALLGVTACAPTVAKDPVPYAMQFDPQAVPPRVPQPTSLIFNPQKGPRGQIDFSLANITIPDDCTTSRLLSPAECEFDKYLQTLDGFPTVTPASAPTTAPALDTATLTSGGNVVVVAAKSGTPVLDVGLGFDPVSRALTAHPHPSWRIGELYWVGVRGYDHGVRGTGGSAAGGNLIVGSPTQYLLKQETSLTCGASAPADIDPACPAFVLLSQSQPSAGGQAPAADPKATLFQLESIRLAYRALGGWDLMQAAGLPKSEIAVLWSFPIHSSSVAELDPTAGLVPAVTAPDEIHVRVQGSVDPTTVTPFVFAMQFGSVVVMDLTAAQGPSLLAGFPTVAVSFSAGEIVIKGQAPFVVGHQYGIFITDAVLDAGGQPLVPSPVSVLLKLREALVDAFGHSTISTVSDSDAAMLEVGRMGLASLFDMVSFAGLTRVTREHLVYCFAFTLGAAP